MKKIIFTVFTLAGLSAYACPNFSGNYMCPDDNGQPTVAMKITQRDISGATAYYFNDQLAIYTDGQPHDVSGLGDNVTFKGKQTSVCDATTVTTTIVGDYFQNNQAIAHQDGKEIMSADATLNLVRASSGKLTYGGKDEDLTNTSICNLVKTLNN